MLIILFTESSYCEKGVATAIPFLIELKGQFSSTTKGSFLEWNRYSIYLDFNDEPY